MGPPLIGDPDRMRAVGQAALDAPLAEPGADPGRLAALGYGVGGSVVLEPPCAGSRSVLLLVVDPAGRWPAEVLG